MQLKKRYWTTGYQPGGHTYYEWVWVPAWQQRSAPPVSALLSTAGESNKAKLASVRQVGEATRERYPRAATRKIQRQVDVQVPAGIELANSQLHRIVETKQVSGKGRGVFARVDLESNTRIRYTGKEIDEKQVSELWQMAKEDAKNEHRYLEYLCESGDAGRCVDAHPRHGMDCTAGLVNEPGPHQRANMALSHAGPKGKRYPVLIVIADIKAGEELLVSYGQSFVRTYRVAEVPVQLPDWWSQRDVACGTVM